jgi:uncharacterized protein (TIGR03084 family)
VTDLLHALLDDLDTESAQLREAVVALGDEGWSLATPAPGWTVATQVAHLLWTDEAAVVAATDMARWDELVLEAIADPMGYVDTAAHEVAALARSDVLDRWASARSDLRETLVSVPDGTKIPWFGPPMSPTSMATARFMETWAHSLDVFDAAAPLTGWSRPEPTDRIRPVAHLGVRTRNYAYSVHGEEPPADEFQVTLVAPSGDVWTWGPDDAAQTVTGSAYDFCLLVTQRVHRDDTDLVSVGGDAEHWLTIAQAFAGPPGPGRVASDG